VEETKCSDSDMHAAAQSMSINITSLSEYSVLTSAVHIQNVDLMSIDY